MPLHAPSLPTWAAVPLDPDGEYGALSPWRLLVGLLSAMLAGAGLLLMLVDGAYRWGWSLLAAAVVVAAARAAVTGRKRLLWVPRPGAGPRAPGGGGGVRRSPTG